MWFQIKRWCLQDDGEIIRLLSLICQTLSFLLSPLKHTNPSLSILYTFVNVPNTPVVAQILLHFSTSASSGNPIDPTSKFSPLYSFCLPHLLPALNSAHLHSPGYNSSFPTASWFPWWSSLTEDCFEYILIHVTPLLSPSITSLFSK